MSSNRHGISRLGIIALQVALGLTALASHGQTALPTPRVLSEVDAAQTVALRGNTHPLAQARFDRGRVDDATPAGRMLLVLKRSDEQQTALDRLLAAQQDPRSASYRKWLTPESFGAQFGVADADLQAVTSYLAAQGLTVGRVFPNKLAIEFSGTAGQIRSAFQTEIHTYVAHGQTFHANASDPKIPAALSPVVAGVASMHNFKAARPAVAQSAVLNRKASEINPLYTNTSNGNTFEAISPGDLAAIYDIPATSTGQGVTVGVVNDSNINLAIATNYRTTFGLSPTNVPTVIADGSDPGINDDDVLGYEAIELVSAVAPAATINYYVSGDTDYGTGVDFAALRAVLDNTAQVLVFPFQACERDLGVPDNYVFTQLWEQAAAQGISVIVPAGDGGSEQCDAVPVGTPKTTATQGLAVNGYASTAYDTAVGATDFYYAGGFFDFLFGNHFDFTFPATSYTSAKGYIPEQPFNDSSTANHVNFLPSVVQATGGGVSTLGEVTLNLSNPIASTQGPHPQPSYQASVASGISTTARVVPDVSLFGGLLGNFSAYVACVRANDCVNGTPASLQYTPVGGSTTSAAVFGGVAALVVQAKGAQGNLNPALYATQAKVPNAFHDLTVGSNAVACTGPDCSNGFSSSGSGVAYPAATGYDAASGLGSVDVKNLISGWQAPTAAPTVLMSFSQPATSTPVTFPVAHGAPIQVNVLVSGGSGVPTGDIVIETTSPQALSGGLERLTLNGGKAADPNFTFLPGGSYNVVARYGGDQNYGAAVSAPVSVTVSGAQSRIAVLSQNFTNGSTVTYGAPVQFTLSVFNPANANDGGAATGSMLINDSNKQSTILPMDSVGAVTFQSNILDPGFHTFAATYSGDNSYAGSSISGTLTVNVAAAPTTTTLTSATTSLPSRNSTVSLVATVTPTTPVIAPSGGVIGSGGRAPRGSVQFIVNGKLGATIPLLLGENTGANPYSTAIFREGANGFSSGPNVVTATYVPDISGDYAVSSSAPVTLNIGGTGGLSSASVTLSTTPAGAVNFINTSTLSFTAAVTVPGKGAVTGNVTFYSNGTQIGQPVTVNNGTATLNVPTDPSTGLLALPLGQNYIVAEYSGDSNNSSASNFYPVSIYGAGSTPDFSLQSAQTYAVVSPTVTSATFRLQLNALDGFAAIKQNVALTFTTPAGITCSATPASVTFGGNPYTNSNVTCTAASGYTFAGLSAPSRPLLWMAEGGAALACVLLFGVPTRRRSWQAAIGSLALIVVAFGMTGCGANLPDPSKTTTTKAGTLGAGGGATATVPRGTYTVLVTGTANVFANSQTNTTVTVVHTLPLNIVVQ